MTEGRDFEHWESSVSTPTDEQDQGVWLTQEAHDRLRAELDQLIANRPAMAKEINDRREEGDLKENGGDHAARAGEGEEGGRVRQRTRPPRKARAGAPPPPPATPA